MHKRFHLYAKIFCLLDTPIDYSEDYGTKVLDPTQQVCLVFVCSLFESTRNKKTQNVYMLECISKGYQLLRNKHMDDEDFGKLVKESGMIRRMLEEITDGFWGIYFSH